MRIRVLVATVDVAGQALFRGDEYDLADDEAEKLIAASKAERVGDLGASSPDLPPAKEIPGPPADKAVRRRTTKSGG